MAYQFMLGLTYTAFRYEQSMNQQLSFMAESTLEAAALSTKASWDEADATAAAELAAADEETSLTLLQESHAMMEASERDSVMAQADETLVQDLRAKALVEQGESEAHTARAFGAVETADAVAEQGASKAMAAARYQTLAVDEEVAVGLCQVLPLVDVACDILGGATVLAEESLATDAALASVADSALAAAAMVQQDEEAMAAARDQELVWVDSGQASEWDEQAVAASIRSREEAGAAVELEAEAAEVQEKAVAEEEDATREAVLATSEQEGSARLWQQAAVHGAVACGNGIVAVATAMIALFFFVTRCLLALCCGGPSICGRRSETKAESERDDARHETRPRLSRYLFIAGQGMSLVWLHVLAMAGACAIMNSTTLSLAAFGQYERRDRGEVILRFACLVATLQTILLHAPPYAASRRWALNSARACCDVAVYALEHFILVGVLAVLEFVHVWVLAGSHFYKVVSIVPNPPWLPLLAVVSIPIHWFVFQEHALSTSATSSLVVEKAPDALADVESDSNDWEPIGESTRLIQEQTVQPKESAHLSLRAICLERWQSFGERFRLLQYPWELLVSSSVCILLLHCVPILRHLWPVSKALIWEWVTTFYRMHATLLEVGGPLILCALATTICSFARCRRSTSRHN